MRLSQIAGFGLAALASVSNAIAIPDPMKALDRRATTTTSAAADATCTNGPKSRACWTKGFSVATDFDQKFPTTGNTVSYNLDITNGTCNPDGNGERICMLINGKYGGPLIRAAWGDRLHVTVTNHMQDNGTSIHWHGVRQYSSSEMDGVNGVTQCAIAPGKTMVYDFLVTQFGSSWYHSHFSSQYGDGVVGPIVFDGPATANYDEDLGPYMLTEWYYSTAWQMQARALQNLQKRAPPPPGDNVLINGTNKNANGGGQYNQVSITAGKKYRLRLMNVAVDNFIKVSLDNHTMQVMAADFIPIKPFAAQWLTIGIGQRYDVVINANQAAGSYWFRADVPSECLSANNFYGRAVWTYDSVKSSTPSSSPYAATTTCAEPSGISPYWYQPIPSDAFQSTVGDEEVNITKAVVVPGQDAVFVWALNTSSMDVSWGKPTISYILNGDTNYPDRLNVLPTVSAGKWNYWLVQTVGGLPPIPHPMHLHGHDFFVLGSGGGRYSSSASLNWNTPPRRDTAVLPGGGWLAIAFNSNNPGTWLLHCHIAWHISEGLGLQFVESPSQISLANKGQYDQVCTDWNAFEPTMPYIKDDSGL
ncbi:multicopper oxidase [Polychaeton citri CBS 116435]|uniref:laccase n=1 Tax=Polychaeton citri CBS 116435 TaxID=1314669 RepID=A0A9P4UMZ5_9PEZI|nr:multicopper oxidase [Polychaeton citri CBS 116435]